MKLKKQQKQWLVFGVLLAVLAFTLRGLFAPSEEASGVLSQPGSSRPASSLPLDLKDYYLKKSPKKAGGKKEISFQEIDPSLHLESLSNFDPGKPLNARNMFSVGASPPERTVPTGTAGRAVASSGSGDAGGQVASSNPVSVRPVAPPPVIINLKFFGTKTDARARRIQGFFADGDEVYLVSEGDLVANRYRVIRIGDNSAEVEELSSKTRRQISLLTQ
jgi:hypothetical protein